MIGINSLGTFTLGSFRTLTMFQIETIQAKARLEKLLEVTIQARARLLVETNVTSQAKARILKLWATTNQAKARILKLQETTIQSKATIFEEQIYSVQSKGRLKQVDNDKTISSMAMLNKLFTQTATAKANIKSPETGVILGTNKSTGVLVGKRL